MSTTPLKLIHHLDQAPPDSYVFYHMNGGISYCMKADYRKFSRLFTRIINPSKAQFTMDLSAAQWHSLFFDVDCKEQPPVGEEGFDMMIRSVLSSLRVLLLPKVHNFTMIVTTRRGSSGLHVHLPEFSICYDDYIQLCTLLQPQFSQKIYVRDICYKYELDIPINFSLTNSVKPGTSTRYEPHSVYYVEEGQTLSLDCRTKPLNLDFIRKKFKRNRYNVKSYFRTLLLLEEMDIRYHFLEFLMPVSTPYDPLWKLSFTTVIAQRSINEEEGCSGVTQCSSIADERFEDVAEFTQKQHPTPWVVRKGTDLKFDGSNWLKTYHYLKFNWFLMDSFESSNNALKVWYNRIKAKSSTENSNDQYPVFQSINEMLKEDNFKFYNDPNPLKTVLEYNNGYYLLPTFYALTRHLDIRSSELIQHLRGMLDPACYDLLDRLERVPDKHIELTSKQFTVNSILFSGHNLYPKPSTMKDKLQLVFTDMKRQIFSASSARGLVDVLRTIQDRHFPVIVITLAFSVKKPMRYIWNSLRESWQEVTSPQDVKQLMETIWDKMKLFIHTYPKQSRGGLLEEHVLSDVRLSPIVSSILSESNMERLTVQVDRHKWLIRTNRGTLDILTRHIGGTVPEHFISERQLGVQLNRFEVDHLHDPRNSETMKDLWRLYESLVSKKFFYKYLKACFCDATDNLVETLRELVYKDLNMGSLLTFQPRAESMLQFYVHLCKYSTFDYYTMMYLLDVLSSLFVATNYARKFFVIKGVTKNGKSKLFQIISRVYGAYCSTIRCDNIRPNSSSSLGPMPELASTLFSSRVVVIEEIGGKLNENLIKEITGNSTVTFRNMYEQNQGGVPTAKIFASTNTIPTCLTTTAFQDRVVAIPFEATFVDGAPATTSEQLMKNEYPLDTDESLIENCHKGFFLLTYFHFIDRLDMDDATVHYRPEPERLKEFKRQYLAGTNVYHQFKQVMDVQIVNNDSMTTMNELTSAIRQFLSNSKITNVQVEEMIEEFNAEFQPYRRSDVIISDGVGMLSLGSNRSETTSVRGDEMLHVENEELSLSDLEEEVVSNDTNCEPRNKKRRKSCLDKPQAVDNKRSIIVYYHNVIIKNMKRVNTGEI